MILNPAVIALIISSLLNSIFGIYSATTGVHIIKFWDLESGSDLQLALERKTYLVSTILTYLFCFQMFSLFLFIHTAEDLHPLFIGAMCAAGSLNVNDYGYPTLILKIVNFILCGLWLILNHTDNKGYDYPLIKSKYKLLVLISLLLVIETFLQTNYFLALRADVITSCCGTLFNGKGDSSLPGDLPALPWYTLMVFFYLGMVLMLRTGLHFTLTGRGAPVFAWVAAALMLISMASVISFISVYYFELPTHHCPFCLLQSEYHFVGYPLYLSMFLAGVTGTGIGMVDRYRGHGSLQKVIPPLQKTLCIWSMAAFLIFMAISTYPILFSSFRLE